MEGMHMEVSRFLKEITPESIRPTARHAFNYLKNRYDKHVYERPSGAYRRRIADETTLPSFLEKAESLCRDGLLILPSYFDTAKLDQLKKEFERLIETTPVRKDAARTNSIHISTERLAESRIFSELAFEPNILALARYYWGKPVVLNGTGGTRIEPFDTKDYGSYQWHHDGKRKQVRVFILLTDVPDDGQRTDVVVGSNHYWYEDLTSSRLDRAHAESSGKVVACAAPAGSVIIFDTNAMHRGNRNNGPRRDAWDFSYKAPNALTTALAKRPPLSSDVVANLTDDQRFVARLDGSE